MKHNLFLSAERAAAYIASRSVGDKFEVRFAGRGIRTARVVSVNRAGRPIIETYDRTNRVWKSRQPLTVTHFGDYAA